MSRDLTTTEAERRAEAARWMPEAEWYPRALASTADAWGPSVFSGYVGRYMLFVSYGDGGYENSEFCNSREEMEDRAAWAGSSQGGYCRAVLDLEEGEWLAVVETRSITLTPSTAFDLGMEPEEVDA
jgi:hypothetical protein